MANVYFTISSGQRGCYMPDDSAVYMFATRRELKWHFESECSMWRDAGFTIPGGKKEITRFVAECWRRRNDATWRYDMILGLRREDGNESTAIMVSRATRAEYLEHCKNFEY